MALSGRRVDDFGRRFRIECVALDVRPGNDDLFRFCPFLRADGSRRQRQRHGSREQTAAILDSSTRHIKSPNIRCDARRREDAHACGSTQSMAWMSSQNSKSKKVARVVPRQRRRKVLATPHLPVFLLGVIHPNWLGASTSQVRDVCE